MREETKKYFPPQYQGIVDIIPKDIYQVLVNERGNENIISMLKKAYRDVNEDLTRNIWESVILFYRYNENRYFQAINVAKELYYTMIEYEEEKEEYISKGMPLVWIRDNYIMLESPFSAKKYMMLTLIEDAIRDSKEKGKAYLNTNQGGSYFRLSFYHGMSDNEINRYVKEIFNIYLRNEKESKVFYPDWFLLQLSNEWMIEYPAIKEHMYYEINREYLSFLIEESKKDERGKIFEELSAYLLSGIPGFRTKHNLRTDTFQIDILCENNRSQIDPISELGLFIPCECKNETEKSVSLGSVAKFHSLLESTKCKAGIVFSINGLSGEKNEEEKFAAKELIKIYQRSGITILNITMVDIELVQKGENFISILKKKYKELRFDYTKNE
jgi:hypothetical protein